MIYTCCDEQRRAAVDAHPVLNGIDWLEVADSDAPEEFLRQRILAVRFLKPVPGSFSTSNVTIEGGERIRNVRVTSVAVASDGSVPWNPYSGLDDGDHVLLVLTDRSGDFSAYRLRLRKGQSDDTPPEDFDPRLVEVPFSFKVECPGDFDCRTDRTCEEEEEAAPDIDYLVKDYAGFRRLMLDRLSRLVPEWRQRTPADLGVALTELLADTADQLSYWQDAVATEAYLETARLRTSLRRHALLVDYRMHEGCNARAWVQVRVKANAVSLERSDLYFLTRASGAPERMPPDTREEAEALAEDPLVFEPMHDAVLYRANNTIHFYTWGDSRCCLPEGATAATLRDHPAPAKRLRLRPGDVLIFEERIGPLTGLERDADPLRRHAVRLTRVSPEAEAVLDGKGREVDRDPGELRLDPLTADTGSEQGIVEVEWDEADALPFPLCLSSRTDEAHGGELVQDVSVALGNVTLADHGRTVKQERLGSPEPPRLRYPAKGDASHCDFPEAEDLPPRFRPLLAGTPLTWIGHVQKTRVRHGVASAELVPFDPESGAGAALSWQMDHVLPGVLDVTSEAGNWEPRRDLLQSAPGSLHFVVEAENDGGCRLRFGDDGHGRRPDAASDGGFTATYRVGSGTVGNVGPDAIAHVVTDDGRIEGVRNPLPARGGTDPETMEQVRRRAPQAFRTQERAVTPRDYAGMTERLPGVQRAAGSLRWTGSWHTVFVTVDRLGGRPVEGAFAEGVHRHLGRYRMAGHDLRVDEPVFVSLEMDLLVCVAEGYFRSHVRQGLLEALGSGVLPGNRRGVFHPDNFTFGQTVYLSPVYAAARAVPGVASVEVTRFQRLGDDDPKPLSDRFLALGPPEIARLSNDPNFTEHGVLRLELHGGK